VSSLIEVQNLQYRYPNAPRDTLLIPDFKIDKGERVYLHGPSGSGKTTLLEIFAGILKVEQGEVRIAGQNLATLSESERDHFRAKHLGYIFQSFNLIPYLSVQENIELPIHMNPTRSERPSKAELTQTVHQLCQRLGIEGLLSKNVTELSVGQQQRVAVARALCGKPDLILADEPTSSLDTDHRERFLQLMFELCDQAGTTVLFVSHDRTIQNLFSRAVSLESINKVEATKAI
jgi:putative ABC transport system ATP-binding protein